MRRDEGWTWYVEWSTYYSKLTFTDSVSIIVRRCNGGLHPLHDGKSICIDRIGSPLGLIKRPTIYLRVLVCPGFERAERF